VSERPGSPKAPSAPAVHVRSLPARKRRTRRLRVWWSCSSRTVRWFLPGRSPIARSKKA